MKWNIFDKNGDVVDMLVFITPGGYQGLYSVHLWEFGIADRYSYLYPEWKVNSLRRTHKVIEVKND